jgi:hypothetical protein
VRLFGLPQAIRNRILLARFIGELAVTTVKHEIDKQLEQTCAGDVGPRADGAELVARVEPAARPAPPRSAPQMSAESLPISDYESLAAINIVERLRTMNSDELEMIRTFEAAHRARRTILAKIAQLQGES